jgi:hypothetical protein
VVLKGCKGLSAPFVVTQTEDGYTCSEPNCWMLRHGGLPCAHLWCYLAVAEMQDGDGIHRFMTLTDGKSEGGLFPDAVFCKTVLKAIGSILTSAVCTHCAAAGVLQETVQHCMAGPPAYSANSASPTLGWDLLVWTCCS